MTSPLYDDEDEKQDGLDSQDDGTSDSIGSSQAAPSAPPQPDRMAALRSFLLTPQDLQQARQDKLQNAALGGIANSLSNEQSAGNFATGKLNPHIDAAAPFRAANENIDQGVADKGVMLKQQMEQPKLQNIMALQDPTSDESSAKRNDAKLLYESAAQLFDKTNPQLASSYRNASKSLDSMSGYGIANNIENSPVLKMISAQSLGQQKNDFSHQMLQMRQDQMQERMDNSNHQRVLGKLQSDKQLGQRMVQYQNLDNAMSNLLSAQNLTPQQVDEFQQSIRSNLGIKGTSGVGEREHTYINSLGLNYDRLKQFITGDPADIAKDSKLLDHLRNLAMLEKKNIEGQYGQRINSVAAGNGSMYARRPDLKSDLDSAIGSYQQQLAPPQQNQAQGSGLPGVGNANAAQSSKRMVSDDEINQYAQKHQMQPDAAKQFLRSQGYGTN